MFALMERRTSLQFSLLQILCSLTDVTSNECQKKELWVLSVSHYSDTQQHDIVDKNLDTLSKFKALL
jgi:hypothetical protein